MSANLSLSGTRVFERSAHRRRTALALMAASGFAGLGYQIVWTQQTTLWLGHEVAAVMAVVTAFFGGLAVGAWLIGARAQRSARPERWYAACEAVIGLWSVALALLLQSVSQSMLELIGTEPSAMRQWLMAFGGTFVVLLPATAAMGATLPALERVVATSERRAGGIAELYAGNTLGAVLGVLACAFWLIPHWGLARTALACALLNGLCALAGLTLAPAMSTQPAVSRSSTQRRTLLRLALTGLLGIGFEVVVVRVLSQVAEDTVYTFALLLAVYLIGTAGGAAAYRRWCPSARDADALRGRLLALQTGACLMGASSLWGAEAVKQFMLDGLGVGMASALSAECTLAILAFAAPTFVMGALFSHLAAQSQASGGSLGLALACNTLGAALAPVLFGVVLMPAVGAKWSLLLITAGYAAMAGLVSRRRAAVVWTAVAAAALVTTAVPPLTFIGVPEGGRVVRYLEGTMAAVSVVEDAQDVARLHINNRQQEGSSATVLADARQALLPLLLHPAPRRALFLGLGTGVTASAAASDPSLEVDAVELLPEVIQASEYFRAPPGADAPDNRPRLIAADARRFVRTAERRYDVIVADNFHPARSGSGALYTVEHFRAVRERLSDRGVFCQWLPLHQLDIGTLRSIVRSFTAVYPRGWAMLATNSLDTPVLGLVAALGDHTIEVQVLRRRLETSAFPQREPVGIVDEFALLGGVVGGPQALARFAGDALVNTDDHPVVAYRAPRITYAPDTLPRERLLALLREMRVTPQEVIDPGEGETAQRVAAYWAARDRYLEVGMTVRPSADPRRMLDQVREPLLEVLRISPDFRPAYDPLLRMALALAPANPVAATALLIELRRLQPQRAEAQRAIDRLAPPNR